jgi:hypothetical protein
MLVFWVAMSGGAGTRRRGELAGRQNVVVVHAMKKPHAVITKGVPTVGGVGDL